MENKRPTSDGIKGTPEHEVNTIGETEPSEDLTGAITYGSFEPPKLKDIPINLSVGDKWYVIKSNLFEGDLPSNEAISLMLNKVFKLHKLIMYMSLPGAYIDVEYYIKENDLMDLLEEKQ